MIYLPVQQAQFDLVDSAQMLFFLGAAFLAVFSIFLVIAGRRR